MKRTFAVKAVICSFLVVLPGCPSAGPAMPDGDNGDMQPGGENGTADPGGGDVTQNLGQLAYVVTGGFTGAFGIYVISTETNEIVADIDTGGSLGSDVAITPDGSRAYVVGVRQGGGGIAWAISTATNEVVATIETATRGIDARFVKISPDGAVAYSIHGGSTGAIYVLSTVTNEVIDTIEIGLVAGDPKDVELTPDGAYLYIVDGGIGTGTTTVVSTETGDVDFIDTDTHTRPQLAMTPDGGSVYVPGGIAPEMLSVISVTSSTVVETIDFPPFFDIGSLIVSPDGNAIYVLTADNGLGVVTEVSTASNTITSTTEMETPLNGLADLAFRPDGAFIYAAGPGNVVHTVSTATNTVVDSVSVGISPHSLALTPDGTRLYVTNSLSNSVSVVSTETNTVVDTIMSVGDQPRRLAVMP